MNSNMILRLNMILVLILFLIINNNLFSQTDKQIFKGKGVQVIIKGKITDEFTGNPVSCNIEMMNQAGKKIKTTSNSNDGYYEQVLNAGESIEFTFFGFDIVKKSQTVQLENSTKTTEKNLNFTVRKLSEGTQLYALNGFDKGTTRLNWAGNAAMKELEDILKFNRGAKFEFIVSPKDSYSSTVKSDDTKSKKDKKEKKSKKKKKSDDIESSNSDSVGSDGVENLKGNKLVDTRIESLKELTKDWVRFKNRITYNPDYKAKEGKFNLIIKVTEIKNLFE